MAINFSFNKLIFIYFIYIGAERERR